MSERRYDSPTAFRRALTDRLRALSKSSRWELPQLQRQFAYDQLLQRLYAASGDWIVKGATALLAREIGVRGTLDIDVYRDLTTDAAEAELRAALVTDSDSDNWFRFTVGPRQVSADGAPGIRLPVSATVGTTVWTSFRVDLVGSGLRMTGTPDEMPPLTLLEMPEVLQRNYLVYPLVDHVADKIAATFSHYGRSLAPSTRYKDLVDLVVFATNVTVSADAQRAALKSEAERRAIDLPLRFDVPDRQLWEPGYAAEARRSLLAAGRSLDEALTIVRPFIDPLLDGSAKGSWDTTSCRWE